MTADTASLDVARSFVRLIMEGHVPSVETLALRLDELVLAYHRAPGGEPADEDAEPMLGDAGARYEHIARRFTDLGLYSVADPLEVPAADPLVSDGIDDLADIVRDMEEVLWRQKFLGADDANWHFRLLFTTHWGQHARELALYLHTKLW